MIALALLLIFVAFLYVYSSVPIRDKVFGVAINHQYLEYVKSKKETPNYSRNHSYEQIQLAQQERLKNHSFTTTRIDKPSKINERFLKSTEIREKAYDLKNVKTFRKTMKFL